MGWIQLNLRVKEETKEALRKLCDEQGISFAQALQTYVEASDRAGYLLASNNSIDDNASKSSILDATTILEKLERLEKDSDRISLLEQKLEQVLADRDNFLSRIANQQNQHLEDIKQIYKDANDLNTKLETENYQLQKYNDDAQRENQFLEARLNGIPIADPQYVMLLEQRLQALEKSLQAITSKNNKTESVDGLTSHQLAEILKCDRSTISRWKRKGDPRLNEWELKDEKWYRKSNC